MELLSLAKILLLSAALSLCHGTSDYKGVFEPLKVYTYTYEAIMHTGASYTEDNQKTGSALQATLRIKTQPGNTAIFYLKDIKRGIVRSAATDEEVIVDYSKHEEHLYKEQDKMMGAAFVVRSEDGMIKTTEFNDGTRMGPRSDHENFETMHWKMAIAELFQGDFQRLLNDRSSPVVSYENEEDGIGGFCTNKYFGIYKREKEEIIVRKDRFYDRCTRRPHFFFSSIIGTPCGNKEINPYEATAQSVYQIKTPRNSYLTIEEISAIGEISLRPFGEAGQTVKSRVTQKLKLKEVTAGITIEPPYWEEVITKTSLSYVSPQDPTRDPKVLTFNDLKKAHYYNRILQSRSPLFHEMAGEFLTKESDEKTQYEQILRLIGSFKTFSYDDFVNFFEKNFVTRTPNRERQIAFHVLPFVGTNPAILFLFDRTEDGTIHPLLALSYIASIPFHAKEPSPALMQAFWNFLHSDVVVENELLFPTSWVAFGSFLRKGCGKGEFTARATDYETYADQDTCTAYLKKMIKAFYDETIPDKQLLLLRAIKNARFPTIQTNDFLLDLIQGRNKYKPFLRREALFAVLDLYGEHQTTEDVDSYKRLLKSVEDTFLDKSEEHIVRMAAFETIAKTVSSPKQAEEIVFKWLQEEESQKVAGFMYSTLEYLANSTTPCNQIYSSLYGEALRSVVQITSDPLKQGVNKYYTYFNENYNFGHTTRLQLIPSNDSVIPVDLNFKHTMNFMGYSVDKIEIGNYISDTAFLNEKLLDMLAPILTSAYLNGIPRWLHLKNVKLPTQLNSKEAETFMSHFSQDVLVLYWYRLIESGSLSGQAPGETVEQNFHGYNPYMRKTQMKFNFYYDELEYSVVNELGIPVQLSLIIPGKVSSDVVLKNNLMTGILEVKWTTGVFSGVRASMTVQSMVDPHGFRLETLLTERVPLNFDINLRAKTLELKPSVPFDLVTFHSTPSTFYKEEYKEVERDQPIKFEKKIGHDYFGVGATINASIAPQWFDDNFQNLLNDLGRFDDNGDMNTIHTAGNILHTIIFWNPTLSAAKFNVRMEPATTNPTTTFKFGSFSMDKKSLRDFKAGMRLDAYGPTPRYWNMDVKAFSDDTPSKSTNHRALHLSRGPIPDYDSNKFEVCLDFENTLEKMSTAIFEPMSRKVNPLMSFNAKLVFGQSCKSPGATEISVKGSGKVGQHSKIVLENNTRVYEERCQQNTQLQDIEFCLMETAKSASLEEFRADLKYVNIPTSSEGRLVYSGIRQLVNSNVAVDTEFGTTPVEDGEVTLVANRSLSGDFFDLSIVKPQNESRLLALLRLNDMFKTNELQSTENIGRFNTGLFDSQRATCYFTKNQFNTFDEVDYNYALDESKYHVVMTHCPTQKFAILIRTSKDGEIEMVINVGVLQINVSPLLHKMTLTDPQNLSPYQTPYMILRRQKECTNKFCSIQDSRETVLMTVEKTDDSTGYYIHSEPFKIDMFFNGKIGAISTSDLYKGSLCGLCGNLDGERTNEFMGPDRTVYKEATNFVQSYSTDK